MEQLIKVFLFNDQEIEFDLSNNSIMVNATEMAKVFDKDLFQFTKSDNAKAFIKSCLKPANAGLLGVEKEEDLIISKQKSGTWMHRVLALKFAAWLSPDFEVWVFATIDDLLFGKLKQVKVINQERITLQTSIAKKRKEILRNSRGLY